MVTDKDVWEQKQIKTALSLGIGKGREDIKLLTSDGDKRFTVLMKKVKEITGL